MSVLRNLAAIAALSIVVIWLGYPLTIALLAGWRRTTRGRRRDTAIGRDATATTVSVMIATRADASAIGERIADCLRGSPGVGELEIVIGIDAHAALPRTGELPSAPNVLVVPGDPPGGKAAALNAAVRAARGDVLLFTDVHQRFAEDAIPRLIAAFADPKVGAVSGRLELSAQARRSPIGRYWSYERWLRRSEADVHSCVGATGAIWAMRRALWAPLPPTLINDDMYTPMRVVLGGHRVAFADDARAMDLRRAESSTEYRRKVRTLTGIIQLCAWLPQVLVPFRNPIWPQFVMHKLLRLLTPYWLILILLWCATIAAEWTRRYPAVVGVVVLVIALAAIVAKGKAVRLVRRSALWGLRLQAAVVVAMVNGFRRRWDVWGS